MTGKAKKIGKSKPVDKRGIKDLAPRRGQDVKGGKNLTLKERLAKIEASVVTDNAVTPGELQNINKM